MGFGELAILYVELRDKGFQVNLDLKQERLTIVVEGVCFEITEKEEVREVISYGRF